MNSVAKLIELQREFDTAVRVIERYKGKEETAVSEMMLEELHVAARAAGEAARICKGTMPNEERKWSSYFYKYDDEWKELNRILHPEKVYVQGNKPSADNAAKKIDVSNVDSSLSSMLQKLATDDVPASRISSWFEIENDLNAGFDKIAGMKDIRRKLMKCVQINNNSKVSARLKRSNVKSYFFYGLPGCGKTFLIKTFAYEMRKINPDVRVMSLTGGQIHNMYKGVTEKNIEKAFEVAEAMAPCILFIDEIESLCSNRKANYQTSSVQTDTTAFLNSYNRLIDHRKNVIFIGATNYPELIDNAMMDRVVRVRVDLPDREALAHKFSMELENMIQLDEGLTFEDLADYCINFSYRDVEHLLEVLKDNIEDELAELYLGDDAAADEAMDSGKYALTRERFERALNDPMAKPSSKEDNLKSIYEWEHKSKED